MKLNSEPDMKLKIFTLVRFRRMQTFFEDRMLVSKFRLFIADFGFTLKALWLKRKSILLFKIYLDAWTETEGATSRSEPSSPSSAAQITLLLVRSASTFLWPSGGASSCERRLRA